jgi:hypothetical protein
VIGTTPANLKLPLINHTSCDTCGAGTTSTHPDHDVARSLVFCVLYSCGHFIIFPNTMISHNEERTELCLRKTEHIRGYLRYRYSVAVKHVMMANVKLSK